MNEKIQKILDSAVENSQELGTQFCAYRDGKMIVNAYAGKMDMESGKRVDENTLFPVFSTTKGFVAFATHILAEKGILDYDRKISEVWPEFAANGKENVTIRHALTHMVGIPQMPADTTREDIEDWHSICAKVAALVPKTPPGTAFEYHAITFGWIIGETLRRLDGRTMDRIIYEEICTPLGIKDLYLGLPDRELPRVATLYEPDLDRSNIGKEENVRGVEPLHEWMNSWGRAACVPGGGGIMNAGSIARFYAGLLPGGVDGITLLPESRLKTASDTVTVIDENGTSLALGFVTNRGRQKIKTGLPNFGCGGYGGSNGFAFPEQRLAVGFTKNLFGRGDIFEMLMDALED